MLLLGPVGARQGGREDVGEDVDLVAQPCPLTAHALQGLLGVLELDLPPLQLASGLAQRLLGAGQPVGQVGLVSPVVHGAAPYPRRALPMLSPDLAPAPGGAPVAETFDHVVVGGGIVGAATAWTLSRRHPDRRRAAARQGAEFGRHQTGHNSGVIHSGIYYQPGSLKAELCRAGAAATEEFAARARHPVRGVSASSSWPPTSASSRGMHALAERAAVNEIDATVLTAAQLREREPHVAGLGALFVAATGITDYGMDQPPSGRRWSRRRAAPLMRDTRVLADPRDRPRGRARHEPRRRHAGSHVVFCAGVQADRVAAMAGLDVDFAMVPFRGEYYDVRPERADLVDTPGLPDPRPRAAVPRRAPHADRRRRAQRGSQRRAGPLPRGLPQVLLRPARRPRHRHASRACGAWPARTSAPGLGRCATRCPSGATCGCARSTAPSCTWTT